MSSGHDSDHSWWQYGVSAPLFICEREGCDVQKYEGGEYGGTVYIRTEGDSPLTETYEQFETCPPCPTPAKAGGL